MKYAGNLVAMTMAVVAAVGAVRSEAGTLTVDQVKQRYPWNGLVDIDYTIVTSDQDESLGIDDGLEVLMVDRSAEPAVTNRAITFLQVELPMTAGQHRITWNATADGVTNRTANAEFSVSIVHYPARYMVIDVSGGSGASYFPVSFLNGAPSGGFNTPEYKGDKIVLRRIPAGLSVAGSPSTEANRNSGREGQHPVRLSKPFYIGIFEMTQRQYENVMGRNPSIATGDFGPYRPVENVSYADLRNGEWPQTPDFGNNTFMKTFVAKCKMQDAEGNYAIACKGFDLPTEFQWEYACRAGTTGGYASSTPYDNTSSSEQENQLKLMGRYSGNVALGAGGISEKHTVVGSYLPNAWGLYDMHGNIWEWCRDKYVDDVVSLKQYIDPPGPATRPQGAQDVWVFRGGGYNNTVVHCRSGFRNYGTRTQKGDNLGFRLFWMEP